MPTFTISPNERAISVLLNNISESEFNRSNPDYEVKPLELTLEWSVFKDELQIEAKFKTILAKYGVEKHFDNLLYIVLTTFDDIWTNIQQAYDDYESKKRARELAQLLLLLEPSSTFKPNGITFKTPTSDAKISDPTLIKWITETLSNSINNHTYSPGQFGLTTFSMLNPSGQFNRQGLDYDRLRDVAKKRLINPKNSIKKGQFQLCFKVYAYLESETTFKSSTDTLFSRCFQ
jgi:hypothetical protein